MSSVKRVLANRENAKKSTGPRTSAGKFRAGRNALRHGLSSVGSAHHGASRRVTTIAKKLCEKDPFPYRFHVALQIAEEQAMIERIRLARAHVTVASRPPSSRQQESRWPRRPPGMTAMTEEEFYQLNEAVSKGHVRKVRKIIMAPSKRFAAFVKALRRGEKQPMPTYPILPPAVPAEDPLLTVEEQRFQSFCAALPVLERLNRHESRALSRRNRAIRKFKALQD
jgi:hypothetical protein